MDISFKPTTFVGLSGQRMKTTKVNTGIKSTKQLSRLKLKKVLGEMYYAESNNSGTLLPKQMLTAKLTASWLCGSRKLVKQNKLKRKHWCIITHRLLCCCCRLPILVVVAVLNSSATSTITMLLLSVEILSSHCIV